MSRLVGVGNYFEGETLNTKIKGSNPASNQRDTTYTISNENDIPFFQLYSRQWDLASYFKNDVILDCASSESTERNNYLTSFQIKGGNNTTLFNLQLNKISGDTTMNLYVRDWTALIIDYGSKSYSFEGDMYIGDSFTSSGFIEFNTNYTLRAMSGKTLTITDPVLEIENNTYNSATVATNITATVDAPGSIVSGYGVGVGFKASSGESSTPVEAAKITTEVYQNYGTANNRWLMNFHVKNGTSGYVTPLTVKANSQVYVGSTNDANWHILNFTDPQSTSDSVAQLGIESSGTLFLKNTQENLDFTCTLNKGNYNFNGSNGTNTTTPLFIDSENCKSVIALPTTAISDSSLNSDDTAGFEYGSMNLSLDESADVIKIRAVESDGATYHNFKIAKTGIDLAFSTVSGSTSLTSNVLSNVVVTNTSALTTLTVNAPGTNEINKVFTYRHAGTSGHKVRFYDGTNEYGITTEPGQTAAIISDGTSWYEWHPLDVLSVYSLTTGTVSTPFAITEPSGSVINNTGASEKVGLTLPSAVPGIHFTFVVTDVVGLRVTADTGDTIRIAGNTGVADSSTVGSVITLTAINDTNWYATATVGTWTTS